MVPDPPVPSPAPSEIPEEIANAVGEAGRVWLMALLRRVELAEAHAARLEQELLAARERIRLLEEENRVLRARLGGDSSNSSRPPSSDGPGAKAKRRRRGKRKPSGRKAGGQPGHKGVTRELRPVEEADRVVPHFPEACSGCGHGLAGADEAGKPLPHQQYELPPLKLELTHHWLHRLICPRCRTVTAAELNPEEATGQGPRLTAFIGLLTGHNRQSRSLVVSLIDDLFGLRISTGTVQACWERLGEALGKPMAELEAALLKVDAVYLDETGWRQWSKRCWLWVATTTAFTMFMVHPRRGADVLNIWFPDGFDGTVISDRWSAYSFFDITLRQLCWSHLGRDLQAIIDAEGPAAKKAEKIRMGEKTMFRAWWRFRNGDIDRTRLQEEVAPFRASLEKFCKAGAAQSADDLWRKLGTDLVKKWPAVFCFIDRDGVEPTNNAAERAVRPGVILRKLTQGTRSDTGSTCIARGLSAIATCRQQGHDVLGYLTETLTCHWRGIPPPPLLATSD